MAAYDPALTFSLLLPVSAFITLTAASYFLHRNILAPGVFFPLSWTVFILVPVIIAPEFPVHTEGLWMIFLLVFSFVSGSAVTASYNGGGGVPGAPGAGIFSSEVFNRRVLTLIVFLSAAAAAGLVLQVFEAMRMGLDFSPGSLLSIPGTLATARYQDQYTPSWPIRLSVYSAYSGSLLGGLIFSNLKGRRNKLISLLPLLCVTVYGGMHAMRFGIISATFLWISGFLANNIYRTAGGFKITRALRHLFIPVFFLVLIIVILQWARSDFGEFSELTVENSKSLAGYVTGFTVWYQNYDFGELNLGANTFEGAFDLLGLRKRVFGQYADTFSLAETDTANIYTVYRGLIQDFSVYGALVVCFLTGLLSGLVYRRCVDGDFRMVPLLSIFYAFTFVSAVISIFSHNSLLFGTAFVVFAWYSFYGRSTRVRS